MDVQYIQLFVDHLSHLYSVVMIIPHETTFIIHTATILPLKLAWFILKILYVQCLHVSKRFVFCWAVFLHFPKCFQQAHRNLHIRASYLVVCRYNFEERIRKTANETEHNVNKTLKHYRKPEYSCVSHQHQWLFNGVFTTSEAKYSHTFAWDD